MRLGLDIGTNSIGWWLYAEDAEGRIESAINGGVRIFSSGRDPKTDASLAVARRLARGQRRRRDRYLRRRAALLRRLTEYGLMPEDATERDALVQLDPLALRARALNEKLTPGELGRALFHLNQRRGFKSNRKTDRKDNESSKIKDAAAKLDQEILTQGARTFGEFHYNRRQPYVEQEQANKNLPRHDRTNVQLPTVRARLVQIPETKADREGNITEKMTTGYHLYPTRAMLEGEFDKIWQAQQLHHPDLLGEEKRELLRKTIFYQRPLAPQKVGRCLYEEEDRLPKAHPLFQECRLYQSVNHLRIVTRGEADRALSLAERDKLVITLRDRRGVAFSSLARTLQLGRNQEFNLASDRRKQLEGDEVRAEMISEECYGTGWSDLDMDRQWSIIEAIREIDDDEDLLDVLTTEHQLNPAHAEQVARANLPDGHGRIGETASRRILARLKEEVIPYSKAVELEYGHHSDMRTGEILDELPYYGEILQTHVIPGSFDPDDSDVDRWGRITNPTVHIALNQLRRLINAIIKKHGLPDGMVVELGRDLKNSVEKKKEINKDIKKHTDAQDKRREKLTEIGVTVNHENLLRLKLWEELNFDATKRCCIYTGRQISTQMLFDGSCEIDHILPYSRTLDDTNANKIVSMRSANRGKGGKTPYEAWGHTEEWQDISVRIDALPKQRRWRFQPGAMERFEGDRDFLARQLTDMQYISRIAREYLSRLYPDRGTAPVYVVTGQLTEKLRRNWGLNNLTEGVDAVQRKNRTDHRHHAIDAAVIGAVDRGTLNEIARASGYSVERGEKAVAKIPPPWEGFREDIRARLDDIVASHRPDHGTIDFSGRKTGRDQTSGALHNDTAYGVVRGEEGRVVSRKQLDQLEKRKDLDKIRDPVLRQALQDAVGDSSGVEFKQRIATFSRQLGPYQGIRGVRLIENLRTIKIRDESGTAYKGYKGDSNHHYEIWCMPDGKWKHHVVTTFDAHQSSVSSRPHPAAKRIMRLQANDYLCARVKDGPKTIYRVVQFKQSGEICLAEPNEADVDGRNRSTKDPFSFVRISASSLQKGDAMRISIDILGRIRSGRKIG